MVVHQHVGLQAQSKPLRLALQQLEKVPSLLVVAKDHPPLVTPQSYMIPGPWPLDPQRPRHDPILPSFPRKVPNPLDSRT
jgi:hypothetical protein